MVARSLSGAPRPGGENEVPSPDDAPANAAATRVASAPWLAAPRARLAALRARGAQGLMLHGPAGVGKWDLALAFAGDVLCEAAAAGCPACGHCPSCHLVAAGNHPDLRVIVPDALADRRPGGALDDPESGGAEGGAASKTKPSRDIRIGQILALADLSSITAHRGGARVAVLGPAESLNAPAANALLKGLEEPPPGMIFVLVSDQVDRCLPTILSRCALVRVPVPVRAVALEWLRTQAPVADADLRLTEAGGAPLALLRESDEHLSAELRELLLNLLRQGGALDPAEIAARVPRTLPIGASVALFQRWGWDYFAYRMGAGVRYHPGDVVIFEGLARRWQLACARSWMDRLIDLRAIADHALNPRSAIEGALLDYVESIKQT